MDGRRPWHDDTTGHDPSHPPKRQRTVYHGLANMVRQPPNGAPALRYDRYTIAWICALHMEMAAACGMLDEIHEALPTHANESNAYTLGSIEQHGVVIACLPTAQYGANNVANIATNLKRTFPSIRLGLMVGIGGGVPSMADIRLGDIVVGTRVMQYDLGKIVEDGQLQRIGIPKIPPQSLGTLVSTLRSKHELGPSRVTSILRDMPEGLLTYDRPTSPDCLFQATYNHELSTSTFDGCDQAKLVLRSRRVSDDPIIHYGAIASGNQVMRDARTRDHIGRQLDVICFEMEAAGLMDILPCLTIRGICDYSDSHKNKEWQRYAAATAAAYARELLEVLPVTQAPPSAACLPNSHPDSSHDRRQRLLDSLRFEQIDSRKSAIDNAHAKTCQWFLNHPDYQAWLDPNRLAQHYGFLWISGKPGAGKSTMMNFAYASMKRKARGSSAVIASFFFNARGEYLEKSISGMYQSLLLQLLEGFPDLQRVFDDPDLIAQSQNSCPSLDTLKDLFRSAVSSLGQRTFTCFVDALDECDEQQVMDMIQYFEDLAEHSTEQGVPLRICFSSRHYPYIDIRKSIRLKLEDQPGHAEDLANYVGSRLRIRDPALVEELRPQILGKAAGVFLWVVLVVDILNKEDRRGRLALRKRLAEIPSGLSELFKDIMKRDNENMEDLLLCILWILYAKRPLRPEEYCHALWSGLYLKGLAEPEGPDVTAPDAGDCVNKAVISSSKGLAEITTSKQPTVQFIHESVRDFLIKDKGLQDLWPDLGFDWESPSHERLKQCCNAYIQLPGPQASISKPSGADANRRLEVSAKYPFLEYASQHVLYHADVAAVAVPQDEFLSGFPVSDWIKIVDKFEKFKIRQYSSGASLLYALAEKGFSQLIRTRMKEDARIGILGGRHKYPLFAALANGHPNAAAALLEPASVDGRDIIDVRGSQGRTPLILAAEKGYEVVARFLIEKGAVVNASDKNGRTPLHQASLDGHEAVARLLIEKGADANASDKDDWTPLHRASWNGHGAVARLLIEKGADVKTDSDSGRPNSPEVGNGSQDIAAWLRAVGVEEVKKLEQDRPPDMPMTPQEYGETVAKLQSLKPYLEKLLRGLVKWFKIAADEDRARKFFRIRYRIHNQFDGINMKPLLSVSSAEVDSFRAVMESIAKDFKNYLKSVNRPQ
jgi:nucleoside phosphorylase